MSLATKICDEKNSDNSRLEKIDDGNFMKPSDLEFVCDICSKVLKGKKRLKNHIELVHGKKKTLFCDKCDYSTFTRARLNRHVVIKHTDSEVHKCPVCNALINQAQTFKVHMRIHLDEKPYVCEVCDKSFRSNSQLNSHKKIHGEKKFLCEVCGRSFRTRNHVKRHEIIHTTNRPFNCEYCSFSCNVKDNLRKHELNVHYVCGKSKRGQCKRVLQKQDDDNETNESKRGNNVANKLIDEFSKKVMQEVTLNDLKMKVEESKRKEQEKKKAQFVIIRASKRRMKEQTDDAPLPKLNASNERPLDSLGEISPEKSKNLANDKKEIGIEESENSVLVLNTSNGEGLSSLIAIHESTGSVFPINQKGIEASLVNVDNLESRTILQYDETTGEIIGAEDSVVILSAGNDEVTGQHYILANDVLEYNKLNSETPLVIDVSVSKSES